MPAILRVKPEEIDTIEKRGKYTVNVIGCRQIGILYVTAFAESGYKVICTDADQSLVKSLAKGKTPFAEREAESKLKRLARKGQGVKIWFEDKSAILVRPSGTEPIYRLYAEAKNQEKALKLIEDYSSKLEKILETI